MALQFRSRRNSMQTQTLYRNIYLAVYPYKITFNKETPFKTIFYFEKGSQTLGRNHGQPISFEPQNKQSTISIRNIQWIIQYRSFSSQSVNPYKWSLYASKPQTTFLQQSEVKFQDIGQILPQIKTQSKIGASSLGSSYILKHNQYVCKFQKSQITLYFAFFVSTCFDDILSQVQKLYLNPSQHRQLLQLNPKTIVKNRSPHQNSILLLTNSQLKAKPQPQQKQNLDPTASINLHLQQQQKKQKKQQQNRLTKKSTFALKSNSLQIQKLLDLDYLILSQCKQLPQQDPQINNLLSKQLQGSDLVFGIEQSKDKSKKNKLDKQKKNNLDQGMLKLSSDAIKKQQIDNQLQQKQLQLYVIKQDHQQDISHSLQMNGLLMFQTTKQLGSQHNKTSQKTKNNNQRLNIVSQDKHILLDLDSNRTIKSLGIQSNSSLLPKTINCKQIVFILILAIGLFVIGVSINFKKKEKGSKKSQKI